MPHAAPAPAYRCAGARRRAAALALFTLPALQSCQTTELFFGQCTRERLVVSWPVQITQGGETRAVTLTGSTGPDVNDYALLRAALVEGTLSQNPNVMWIVSAFGSNGSFIALSHPYVITPPAGMSVADGGGFGGWGVQIPIDPPRVAWASIRTSAFATVTRGHITMLASAPARYRIELDAVDAAGRAIRVRGDAAFALVRERGPCD